MNWPFWLRRKVREFITAASGGPWPQMREQAERLLEELPDEVSARAVGARPAPARARPAGGVDKSRLPFAPPVHRDRSARRADRNVGMRDLRFKVLERAAKRCEFRCDVPGEPTEVHHIFGGSDRIALESEFTLAGICDACHDRCDESPAWARAAALRFARRRAAEAQARGDAAAVAGFTETAERLEGRIALAEAQALPVTPTAKEP